MLRGQRRLLSVLLAGLAFVAACGDDDDDSAIGGNIDLAEHGVDATILFEAGDIGSGFQSTIASGDFNSDGIADVLVGAPLADGPSETRDEAGEAFVLFGPIQGEVDLSSANVGLRILGAKPGDNLGSGVSAGDLNGDGADDLIIGASGSDAVQAIRTDMGEIYVVFGRSDLGGTVDTLEVQQDVTYQPAEGFSQLGRAMAIADVNGDDVDDLVAGAPYAGRLPNTAPGGERTTVGEVYVFFGRSDLSGVTTVARDQDNLRLSGVLAFDQFGTSVAAADLNADGLSDIVVGASGYDGADGASSEAGGAFVFFASSKPPSRRTLNDADLSLAGQTAETLGASLAVAAGAAPAVPYLALGAPGALGLSVTDTGTGRVYLVQADSLARQGDVASCDCAAVVAGSHAGGFFPGAISAGRAGQLALGYPAYSDEGRIQSGAVFVTAGLPGETDLAIGPQDLASTIGPREGSGLGAALAFADLDADGRDELLVQSLPPIEPAPGSRSVLYVIKQTD